MKTIEQLNTLVQDHISSIEALRVEDTKIWSNRKKITEADAKRSKKIRRMIGDHNNEVARLRRLIRFVELTSEEGVRMMLDQLHSRADRITESSRRYDSKEMRKEYLLNAGMQLIRKQLDELEFLFQ